MRMNKQVLAESCKKNGGYQVPRLNDQLFLQCKGFIEISDLDEYTDLKVLWLEQNAITTIENLDHQQKLVSLFLQNNTIRKMTGLGQLTNLRNLNLSHNYIHRVEGLGACQLLENLQLSHNRIESLEAMQEIISLPQLSCLDLSFNQIETVGDVPQLLEASMAAANAADEAAAASTDVVAADEGEDAGPSRVAGASLPVDPTIQFFKLFPALSVLYLHGNPIVPTVKAYRRKMVGHMKDLTYLDERPVFPEERRTTDAWMEGGPAAEGAERDRIRQEKRDSLTDCVQSMAKLAEEKREEREQKTREWEARQEAKRTWEADQRRAHKMAVNDLDMAEYTARAGVEQEEGDAHDEAVEAKAALMARLEASVADMAEQRRIREAQAVAEAELKEREDQQAKEAMALRISKLEGNQRELQYWLAEASKDDDAMRILEHQLQADLDKHLDELQPGPAPAYHASTETTPTRRVGTAAKTAYRDPLAEVENRASVAAAPKAVRAHVPVLPSTMDSPASNASNGSSSQKKPRRNKEQLYEQYMQWEKTALSRHR